MHSLHLFCDAQATLHGAWRLALYGKVHRPATSPYCPPTDMEEAQTYTKLLAHLQETRCRSDGARMYCLLCLPHRMHAWLEHSVLQPPQVCQPHMRQCLKTQVCNHG